MGVPINLISSLFKTPQNTNVSIGAGGGGNSGAGHILSDAEFQSRLKNFMPAWNTAYNTQRMQELEATGRKRGWEYQMLADQNRPGWNVPQGQVAMSAGDQHVNQLMQFADKGVVPDADMLATAKHYDEQWKQGGPVTKLPLISAIGDLGGGAGGEQPKAVQQQQDAPYGGRAGGQPDFIGPKPQQYPNNTGGGASGSIQNWSLPPDKPQQQTVANTPPTRNTGFGPPGVAQMDPSNPSGWIYRPDNPDEKVTASLPPNARSQEENALAEFEAQFGKQKPGQKSNSKSGYFPSPDIEGMGAFRNPKGLFDELIMRDPNGGEPFRQKLDKPVTDITPQMWDDFKRLRTESGKTQTESFNGGQMESSLYTIPPAKLDKNLVYEPPIRPIGVGPEAPGGGPMMGVEGFLARSGAPEKNGLYSTNIPQQQLTYSPQQGFNSGFDNSFNNINRFFQNTASLLGRLLRF